MGNLLLRGWILAAVLLQSTLASPSGAASVTPSPIATVAPSHHHQHHWTHPSRPLPSRKPCSARPSSSAIPASSVVPSSLPATSLPLKASSTPLSSVVPSSLPSTISPVKASSTPYVRPSPSHSPHWTYTSRPLPNRSPCSSSVAIPTSSSSVSISVAKSSTTTGSSATTIVVGPSQGTQTSSSPTTEQLSSSQVSISGSAPTSTTPIPSVSATTPPFSQFSSSAGSNSASQSATVQLTTSTVLSTRTAKITACPSSVVNCPADSKTTFVTTETIVVSTTICPVTEAEATSTPQTVSSPASATGNTRNAGSENGGHDFTTSTVYSTRTATITACPSSVTNCPLRSKTTYLTTETLVVSTTVCPITDATATATAGDVAATAGTQDVTSPAGTQIAGGNANIPSRLTTSTIYATRTATILACPESVTDCPLRSKTTSSTVETVAVATTVYPVSLTYTTVIGEAAEAISVAATVTVANSPATETGASVQDVSGAGSGSSGMTTSEDAGFDSDETTNSSATYTTTIAVESCSDDGTCTEYANTLVMTQTGLAQATGTLVSHVPHLTSGASSNRTVSAFATASASSTLVWAQSTPLSGMTTAAVSKSSSAVNAVYTGAASLVHFPITQVFVTCLAMLMVILG